MRLIFGDLDAMLSELKEKDISEVRIETLYDERQDKRGIPFLRLFVTVDALISATLYAHFERVTFRGIKPADDKKVKEIFQQLEAVEDEIKNRVKADSFTIRCGYFQDGSENK